MAIRLPFPALCCALLSVVSASRLHAQDNVFTGTNTGADRVRIAAADFKTGSADAAGFEAHFRYRAVQ